VTDRGGGRRRPCDTFTSDNAAARDARAGLAPRRATMPTDVPNPYTIAMVAAGALILFGFLLLLARRYKRCPSNSILVIYGKTGEGKSAKTLHGGGAFVWPLIQDYAFLDLEPMQISIPLKGALSAENIRVNVPSVFTVAIGTDPVTSQNAAIRLLGLPIPQIVKQTEDIIFGQLRQVIASMRIDDINKNRDQFLAAIQKSLEPELEKIGLVLINVNITGITDESGYIEAIGRKAASEAIQQASIDVAEQEKKGAIGVAAAERVKSIEVANAQKLQEIGTKEAERDQTVKIAELTKEKTIGERAAAFEQEAQAKGEYEILAKKGEGLQRIIEACGGAQPAFQMMMLEHLQALASTAATAISNVKFDKVVVWDGGGGANGAGGVAGFMQNLTKGLPPMLQIMQDVGGVKMPEFLGKLVGDPSVAGAAGGSSGSAKDAAPAGAKS
jgi:uncharacterized membrane protein YqiK